MLDVRGLRAHRFDANAVGNLDHVITPPFDVISPEQREQLGQLSPYNMVHLILPKESGCQNRYERAACLADEWVGAGVLRQDDEESFYLIEQTFRGLDGQEHVRRGFFARVRIPEAGEDLVLDHERTFGTKVADRLKLTEATGANLGAVFVLYDDADRVLAPFLGQMDGRPADATANTIDGVTQRIWRVAYDEAVTDFFRGKKLYIADGHHRFRTAREYRDKMRDLHGAEGEQPYDYVLIGLVSFDDPGLRVWPTHRLVDRPADFDLDQTLAELRRWFDVRRIEGDLARTVADQPGCALGMAAQGGERYLLVLREEMRGDLLGDTHSEVWLHLDVVVLHSGVLQRVLGLPEGVELVYEPAADAALARVESGEKGLAFLVKATPTSQVVACADAHDPMPEKATYFFPKLPSGAVIHRWA